MQVEGTVVKVNEAQTFGSGFTKRTVWIDTEGQYNNELEVEFTKDNVCLLDGVKEGDEVKIDINIQGREWKGERRFISLNGWRIDVTPSSSYAQAQEPDSLPDPEDDDDDIPF